MHALALSHCCNGTVAADGGVHPVTLKKDWRPEVARVQLVTHLLLHPLGTLVRLLHTVFALMRALLCCLDKVKRGRFGGLYCL